MAQYSSMPPYMNAPHPHEMHQQHVSPNGQDPRRPQQPVIHVVGDVRPRLTKEQHDILEAHFQQQNKPSTNTKKGFAEQLGVPLDKINNWFQNRRAKVKQDAKKQTNAINMFHQQIAMAQMNNQPPPQAHEFFAANPHLDPSIFNGMPQPIDTSVQNYQMAQQQPQLMAPIGSMPESHNHATSEEVMHSLQSSGYAYNDVEMGQRPPYVGYEGDEYMFNSQFNMTNVQDFAPYGDMSAATSEGFEFPNYSAAPMQPTHSNGSTPSTMGSVQSNSTMATSVGGMQVPTVSTEWVDDTKPVIHFSSAPHDVSQNAYCSPPEDQANAWMQQPAYEHTFPPTEISRPQSSHNMPPTPPQADRKPHFSMQAELDPNSMMLPPEALSRRASSTSGLIESIGNVDIDSRSSSVDDGFKQPTQPSSLAARRQRPRPAALGPAAMRSASYSSGMPVSPGAYNNLAAPDQPLRRIRSSGVPGAPNGRIQKASNSSGQRSPLNMTFTDAAASPKFARQASFAAVTSPGQSTLAPPTPMTPNDAARFPSSQSHGGSVHSHNSIDHGSPNGIAVSWTSESPAVFPTHAASSPPETPLDADRTAHYHAYMQNMQMYRDTPPQSAPATQQSFGMPMGVPPMPEHMHVNPAHMGHVRRISLPEDKSMQQPMPVFHPTGDMPLTYEPMPYDHLQMLQPQMTVPSQTTAAFPTPPHLAPAPIPAPAGSVLSADFAVHEYTPPSADGSNRNGVGSMPAFGTQQMFMPEAPKTYHFANSGPKDFREQPSQ